MSDDAGSRLDGTFRWHELLRALNKWASASPRGVRSGGATEGGLDYVQLHYRPDPRGPEMHLTFRAELVGGRPVIRVYQWPARAADERSHTADEGLAVIAVVDGPEGARDPNAVCEACSAVGTIGRATRTDAESVVPEVHRFCMDCWPERSARLQARWDEERRRRRDRWLRRLEPRSSARGPTTTFEAATWHGALDAVRRVERAMTSPPPAPMPVADLERLAADLQRLAPQLEGEMPFEVESFIRRYGAPDGA